MKTCNNVSAKFLAALAVVLFTAMGCGSSSTSQPTQALGGGYGSPGYQSNNNPGTYNPNQGMNDPSNGWNQLPYSSTTYYNQGNGYESSFTVYNGP